MAEMSFDDFYKVPNLKFDILRLRKDLDKVLEKKKIQITWCNSLWSHFT